MLGCLCCRPLLEVQGGGRPALFKNLKWRKDRKLLDATLDTSGNQQPARMLQVGEFVRVVGVPWLDGGRRGYPTANTAASIDAKHVLSEGLECKVHTFSAKGSVIFEVVAMPKEPGNAFSFIAASKSLAGEGARAFGYTSAIAIASLSDYVGMHVAATLQTMKLLCTQGKSNACFRAHVRWRCSGWAALTSVARVAQSTLMTAVPWRFSF